MLGRETSIFFSRFQYFTEYRQQLRQGVLKHLVVPDYSFASMYDIPHLIVVPDSFDRELRIKDFLLAGPISTIDFTMAWRIEYFTQQRQPFPPRVRRLEYGVNRRCSKPDDGRR